MIKNFLQSLKILLHGREVKISKEEAIEIAKKACAEYDFGWSEPLDVTLIRGVYRIWTHHGFRGGNFWAHIDGSNGKVLKKGKIPY